MAPSRSTTAKKPRTPRKKNAAVAPVEEPVNEHAKEPTRELINNNAVITCNEYESSKSKLESNAYPSKEIDNNELLHQLKEAQGPYVAAANETLVEDDIDANEPIIPNANEFENKEFSREE
ncbi:hypothetical protein VF21_07826 [Pseudogymnoascus sp. 05NY08]|nr:hypothetical protein VF21_07826 [Pseudogymnoascus sp. 05NY08]